MNVYEAMGVVLAVSPLPENPIEDEENAFDLCRNVVDAYDALAPDWANAPEWAQWYVCDTAGEAAWYTKEPTHASDGWQVMGVTNVSYCESVALPLGIDWRLCKWQRPEVTV